MRNNTYFISDLHLSKSDTAITERFNTFVANHLDDAEELYILGDLFEYWIGDDGATVVGMEDIISTLKEITSTGVKGYFVAGNRDFLVGEMFEQMTGFTVLPDFSIIDLYGHKTLILHGDALCSDDHVHQEFRQDIMLNSDWHKQVLSKSIEERIELARQIRGTSNDHKMTLSDQIMDVNEDTVEETFSEFSLKQIIHGHTHRPKRHSYQGDKERIVLGDWYSKTSYLKANACSFELVY